MYIYMHISSYIYLYTNTLLEQKSEIQKYVL